jgi:hypothetical protein
LATLSSKCYAQANYEKAGGIVDLQLNKTQLVRDGLIAFRVQRDVWVGQPDADGNMQPSKSRIVLLETPLTAQTDQRGIYLNEGETTAFRISVKNKGKPAPGTNLLVVKYNPPDALTGPVNAVPAGGPQVVNILNGTATVISVTPDPGPGIPATIQTKAAIFQADAHGIVTVNVKAANPGFPVLVFYPYAAGQPQPVAPGSFDEVGTAMFTTIRVLPYDDAIVDQFVQLWNSTKDPAQAWNFVYSNILYLYDMIFPVMLKFVPLGDRQRVEAAIDQVLALVSPKYFPESTLAMPITRDLSRGKRTVIELWGGLVKKNYPPQPITKPAVPVA